MITISILLLLPVRALAFYSYEGAERNFNARGVVDASAMYSGNSYPAQLVPESSIASCSTDLRLLIDSKLGKEFRFNANVYQTLQAQSAENTYQPYPQMQDFRWDSLSKTWGSGNVTSSYVTDVLSVMMSRSRYDVTLGRQPISLANDLIFTPNDFFYPFLPGAVDKTFRPGVDAVRADVRATQLSRIIGMGVCGYNDSGSPSWGQSALLGNFSMNVSGVDMSVLGGKLSLSNVVGIAATGEVKGLGLRCEGNVLFPQDGGGKGYLRMSVGADYNWPDTFHLIGEFFYHGMGTTDPDEYALEYSDEVKPDNYLGKYYVGVMASGQPIPILMLQCTALVNVTDPSAAIVPGLVYNASDEVDLMATGVIPVGKKPVEAAVTPENPIPMRYRSEFGAYPYSISVLARIYF